MKTLTYIDGGETFEVVLLADVRSALERLDAATALALETLARLASGGKPTGDLTRLAVALGATTNQIATAINAGVSVYVAAALAPAPGQRFTEETAEALIGTQMAADPRGKVVAATLLPDGSIGLTVEAKWGLLTDREMSYLSPGDAWA